MSNLTPFDVTAYRARLEDRKKQLMASVSSGNCESFEQYKHKCGEIRGTERALVDINEVLKRSDDDDD